MSSEISDPSSLSRKSAGWILAGICLLFLLFRLPLMYRMPGGVDEEQYAVPGLTILQDGIPRMPQFPSRNPFSVFYRSDEQAYFMPPLYFYMEAVFYLLLPPVYGTARLCSATAAMMALCVAYDLTRRWTGDRAAALWSTGLLSFSRVFFDYGTKARPDILCTMLLLVATACVLRWVKSSQTRWLVPAGVALGAAGLTHPFAIAGAALMGLWVAWESRRWRRITQPLLLASVALIVFSLWLPLILMDLETFLIATRNQYGASGSQSFLIRMLMPLETLRFHLNYLGFYVPVWQMALALLPMTLCALAGRKSPWGRLRIVSALAAASFYFTCTFAGTFNQRYGYFAYPLTLSMVCAGAVIATLLRQCSKVSGGHYWLRPIATVFLIAAMVPGSYAQILAQYLRHWEDIDYNAPRFARALMAKIPPGSRCTVDKDFLLDFYAAGYPVLAAEWVPFYFSAEAYPYDYFIAGRFAEKYNMIPLICGEELFRAGREDESFACYAKVFVPSSIPCLEYEYDLPAWEKSPPAVPYWAQPGAPPQNPAPLDNSPSQ